MGKFHPVVSGVLLATAGCAATRHVNVDEVIRAAEHVERVFHADVAADDASLGEAARLDVLERLALTQNADLLEQRARVAASAARVDATGRMPEPEVKYEQWGVPLARPWALGDANAVMIGVRQSIPAPGTLGAEARAAEEDTRLAADTLATRRLDIERNVRRTYFEYLLADREYTVHVEHGALTERLGELARASFRAGRARETDILRLGLELTRVHTELATLQQRRRAAAAMLNTLAGRDPDAPLGPPATLVAEEITVTATDLQRAAGVRPELGGAAHAVSRAEARRDAADAAANRPSFMVGVDYMYMPGMADPHGYGAMVSMSLPWLSGGRRAAARAAEADVAAERTAVASVKATIRLQVADAYARYTAARDRFRIVDRDLLPQARRMLEAAQSSYAAGGGDALSLVDALRMFLDTRLDRERALIELQGSISDVERAVGGPVARRPFEGGTTP